MSISFANLNLAVVWSARWVVHVIIWNRCIHRKRFANSRELRFASWKNKKYLFVHYSSYFQHTFRKWVSSFPRKSLHYRPLSRKTN